MLVANLYGREAGRMASVAAAPPPRANEGGGQQLRAGKRPRPAATTPRRKLDQHKWKLLEREQGLERRRAAEAIRRLDAIEEVRRRARERKLDRDKRRIEFAARIEASALALQRCERGRQKRRVARARARAAGTIAKWLRAEMKRAALAKAIRQRAILRIMVSVGRLVEEQLDKAKLFVEQVIAVRDFRAHRSARIIQKVVRRRVELVRVSAAKIVCGARYWLARSSLRRARIRRDMGRYRGDLSWKCLGLTEPDPFGLRATVYREFPTAGRWWDSGLPVSPPPQWVTMRVQNEEARSRQRARTLYDLIRGGQEENGAALGGGDRGDGGGISTIPSWKAKRWEAGGMNDAGGPVENESLPGGDGGWRRRNGPREPVAVLPIGFRKGFSSRRAASMLDPRDAEKAALLHELSRRHARRKAIALPYNKLSLVEKHRVREREFQEQQEKRRAAAERRALRKEKQKAREIAEAARRKALEAALLDRDKEEKARKRLEKIRAYQETKAARELAEKKALAAQREEERRAKAVEEAKRLEIETAFEKEKAKRLERARRRWRAKENGWRRKDGGASEKAPEMSATTRVRHRIKNHASTNNSRAALASVTTATGSNSNSNSNSNRDGCRKRQRPAARLRAGGGGNVAAAVDGPSGTTDEGSSSLPGVRRSVKVAAGVRDGRRKAAPHGTTVPALPVVPGWKAMAAGGAARGEIRKRSRRRQRGAADERRRGGGERGFDMAGDGSTTHCAADDCDAISKVRNSNASLERLLSMSAGNGDATARESAGGEAGYGSRDSLQQNHAEAEEEGAAEIDDGGSGRRSSSVLECEFFSLETLDSAFPELQEGLASSDGGRGLGETTPPNGGVLSPGWSSCSSRQSSAASETSSGFLSDSAAIREGQALLSGQVAGPPGHRGRMSAAAGSVIGGSITAASAGDGRGGRLAVLSSDDVGVRVDGPESLMRIPSASFRDMISDMSDNREFIDQQRQHEQDHSSDEDELKAQSPSSFFSKESTGYDVANTETEVGVESTHLLGGGLLDTADFQDSAGESGVTV